MERSSLPKFLAALSAGALAIPLLASGFTDVTPGKTAYSEAIAALQERGVLEGYDDGTFKPLSTINRAEFLKIVLEGRGAEQEFSGSRCFPDVRDEWFAPYVCTAKEEGIVAGYPDGTFKPSQQITFVEAGKIIAVAFGQDIEDGAEWYEGYVRALEASRAIPPSISALDRLITRGEMAEMMWRLADGRTDQESKGYLNVKYPEIGVNLAASAPQTARSCADIGAFSQESAAAYGSMRNKEMLMDMTVGGVAAPMAREAEESAAEGPAPTGDADFSRTNIQVEGVDEGDIVKTDGTFLYVVRSGEVTIVKARPADAMAVIGHVTFNDSDSFTPEQVYIDGSRLVVVGSAYRTADRPVPLFQKMMGIMPYPSYSPRTEVAIVDVSTPANPAVQRTLSFEGSQVSSRTIGGSLYLVMNQSLHPIVRPLAETTEEDILPLFQDSKDGNAERPIGRCIDVTILPHVPSPQYLIVAVVPTRDTGKEVEITSILGNAQNVYMSLKNLYVANTEWSYVWRAGESSSKEQTTVYRFAVKDDGVELATQGTVPGRIQNQFSMDEHGDTFRIATTVGQMWDSRAPSSNNLYVLGMDLKVLGSIENIAPGEQIYSTRFLGDRAYMVTFKNTDPLFVFDTSDPAQPKILGKLKIPGYSDYLHPYDATHILGFGKEAVPAKDTEDFAWYQGMKVALFDVSDVEHPQELAKVTIGDRGTESPLLHDHKALLFDRERNLLAFPVRVNEIPGGANPQDPSAYGEAVFQGALVYRLTLQDGFDELGRITHYSDEDYLKSGSSFWGKDISRIVRIDDSLLTVSDEGVQSHLLDALTYEGGTRYAGTGQFGDESSCPAAGSEGVVYISTDTETCASIRFTCSDGKTAFHGDCGCGCKPAG